MSWKRRLLLMTYKSKSYFKASILFPLIKGNMFGRKKKSYSYLRIFMMRFPIILSQNISLEVLSYVKVGQRQNWRLLMANSA